MDTSLSTCTRVLGYPGSPSESLIICSPPPGSTLDPGTRVPGYPGTFLSIFGTDVKQVLQLPGYRGKSPMHTNPVGVPSSST
eukprot:1110870-Rhodomonas_salina.1